MLGDQARVGWHLAFADVAAQASCLARPERAEQAVGERQAIEDVDRRRDDAVPRELAQQLDDHRALAVVAHGGRLPAILPIGARALDELQARDEADPVQHRRHRDPQVLVVRGEVDLQQVGVEQQRVGDDVVAELRRPVEGRSVDVGARRVEEGAVEDEIASDLADTLQAREGEEALELSPVEVDIGAAVQHQVAVEDTAHERAGRAKLGARAVRRAETLQGREGSEHLDRRGRLHGARRLVREHGRTIGRSLYHDGHGIDRDLRGLQAEEHRLRQVARCGQGAGVERKRGKEGPKGHRGSGSGPENKEFVILQDILQNRLHRALAGTRRQ